MVHHDVRFLIPPRAPLVENNESHHNDADNSQPANHTTDDRTEVGARFRTALRNPSPISISIDRTTGYCLVGKTGERISKLELVAISHHKYFDLRECQVGEHATKCRAREHKSAMTAGRDVDKHARLANPLLAELSVALYVSGNISALLLEFA